MLTTAPWTNNERRSAYSSLDITDLITVGSPNVLGVALGAGWRDLTQYKRLDTGETTEDALWRVLYASVHILDHSK